MRALTPVLLLVALPLLGCFAANKKYQYGPPLSQSGTHSLQEAKGKATGRSKPTTIQPADPIRFLGSVNDAVADAQSDPAFQKIFVLITDRHCPDCVRYEKEFLNNPAVIAEAKEGWLFVRSDANADSSLMQEYKIATADLPVVVIVSEDGNESGRIQHLPESPEVLAKIMRNLMSGF